MEGHAAIAVEQGGAGPPADAVRLTNVVFRWRRSDGFVLRVTDFALPAGRKILLTGPSGSGKSTLLNLLCGVATPQQGRVAVLGHDLAGLSGAARDRFRAEHIGIMFQMFNLVPYLPVLDNVLLPLRFAPGRAARAKHRGGEVAEARRLLAALEIEPALMARSASRLSVGQQQRVAAARAMIGAPELVIADEPTSALDRDRQLAFLGLLFAEVERIGATLIMVSHDLSLGDSFDEVVPLGGIARISGAEEP